jgi:hypothetical protein
MGNNKKDQLSLINLLKFNGYHVLFLSPTYHRRVCEYFTKDDVDFHKFTYFPSVEEIVSYYHSIGHIVGKVLDNDDNILYDNMKSFKDIEDDYFD